MKADLQRTGDAAVIVVGGRLTLPNVGRLRQVLLEAFDGVRRVDMFFNDVQEADLSFLQVLCSAHITAVARGAVFTVGGLVAADPVLRLIRSSGAERGGGCPGECPWAGSGAAGPDAAPNADPVGERGAA